MTEKAPIPLTIALDVDNCLFPCMSIALNILNKSFGWTLKEDDITDLRLSMQSEEVRTAYFELMKTGVIYSLQTPKDGAVELVESLQRIGHDVVFLTSPDPDRATTRAEQLLQFFPSVPQENIILTYRKDLVCADVLLDDDIDFIKSSRATHRFIFSKPWNRETLPGVQRTDSYENFVMRLANIDGRRVARESA